MGLPPYTNMTPKYKIAAAALAAGFALSAQAATINLTANNGVGTSGFNAATGWSVAAAPTAGNDYVTGGFLLRTPNSGSNFTFAGDSLTVSGSANFTAANNEAMMWKGGNTTGAVITVNNLIVNGGQIRHGEGTANSFTLAGNLSVGASGAGFATQGGMFVTAAISGSSSITIINSGSTEIGRMVFFQSAANTFTGNIVLNNAQSRLTFNNGGVANFVIGADGVNNSIANSGVLNLDGLFKINTLSADLTPGNDWNLITGNLPTYGTNFAIEGFTETANVWTNNAGTLQFSELTGVLTALAAPIPEPSAFAALAGLAGLGAAALRRRRA
jgi:hypothetical protein